MHSKAPTAVTMLNTAHTYSNVSLSLPGGAFSNTGGWRSASASSSINGASKSSSRLMCPPAMAAAGGGGGGGGSATSPFCPISLSLKSSNISLSPIFPWNTAASPSTNHATRSMQKLGLETSPPLHIKRTGSAHSAKTTQPKKKEKSSSTPESQNFVAGLLPRIPNGHLAEDW